MCMHLVTYMYISMFISPVIVTWAQPTLGSKDRDVKNINCTGITLI